MANGDTIEQAVPAGDRVGISAGLPVRIGLALVLILYGLFLWINFAPGISDPDANGYWAQGSLLFTTGQTWFKPETDSQYVGMHWLFTPSGRYYSRYAPGLPVLVGLVYKVLGYKASVWVNPVLALLSLPGLYLLIRRLMAPGWALVGGVAMAVNPTFIRHALACDAHMAVTFCLIWGLFLLLRWSERGRLWKIFTAGLFLGAIPTIRYPEALFGLGIAAFILWQWRTRPRLWAHCLTAMAGAAIPIVPMLIRNQLAFGAFWRTAYELTNEQTGFALEYFQQHFVNYIHQISGDGAGIFFALGLIGMALMCGVRRWRPVGVLLALLTVPTTVLYMFYYWAPGTMSTATMRFLLPTFPCYTLAGLWCLAQATAQSSRALRVSVAGVALAVQVVWGAFSSVAEGRQLHYQKEVLARITEALDQNTRRGDVVMANQQILQHLDFVRHWRLADAPMMAAARSRFGRFGGRDRDPDAPSPMQEEKRRIQEEKYKGLTPAERERKIAQEMRQWAGGQKVYYVGVERDTREMSGPCFGSASFKIVARVPLPQAPPTPRREGLMGGGMRFRAGGDQRTQTPGPGGGFGPGGGPPPGFGPGLGPPPADGALPAQFGGRMRFGGGGGGFGMGFLMGEKEVVIAEWTYQLPESPQAKGNQGEHEKARDPDPRPARRP